MCCGSVLIWVSKTAVDPHVTLTCECPRRLDWILHRSIVVVVVQGDPQSHFGWSEGV